MDSSSPSVDQEHADKSLSESMQGNVGEFVRANVAHLITHLRQKSEAQNASPSEWTLEHSLHASSNGQQNLQDTHYTTIS